MNKRPFFWHIFPAFFLLILLICIGITAYITQVVRDFHFHGTELNLKTCAILLEKQIGSAIDTSGIQLDEFCKQYGARAGLRITVILPTGRVIADSEKDPSTMDNHGTPISLFTVNRWVTGDVTLPAERLQAYLTQFRVETDAFEPAVGSYLRQLVRLYEPEIGALLELRDGVFVAYRDGHEGRAPDEDRDLEGDEVAA